MNEQTAYVMTYMLKGVIEEWHRRQGCVYKYGINKPDWRQNRYHTG